MIIITKCRKNYWQGCPHYPETSYTEYNILLYSMILHSIVEINCTLLSAWSAFEVKRRSA
jgi:hypothetical protein